MGYNPSNYGETYPVSSLECLQVSVSILEPRIFPSPPLISWVGDMENAIGAKHLASLPLICIQYVTYTHDMGVPEHVDI